MDSDKLYESFKRMTSGNDWKVFEQHIKNIIAVHEKQAITFLSRDQVEDAKRQSWIVEGLMECIEEPGAIIKSKETILSKVNRFLNKTVNQ